MFFSILIPVYNVEKYIRQCVDSVLFQDEQDFEIILCDDGSTDDSGKICDEYHNKFPDKVRVIHKENEGLLLTRRRMIKEARGEWFVHLDSDDYLMSDSLKAIKEIISDTESVDLVLCKIAYGAKDGESIDFCSKLPFTDKQIFEGETKELLYKQLLSGGYMTAIYQKIARRDIVDVDGDYTNFGRVSLAEDHLQSLTILNNSKKAVFLDKEIIYYRYNGSSITKKKSFTSYSKNILSLLDVFSEETKYLGLWAMSNEMVALVAANHCRAICLQIKGMLNSSGDERMKPFLADLSNNEVWKRLFNSADKKTLGRFSLLCYKLIKQKNFFVLKILCKHF